METLKNLLTVPPVLRLPRASGTYTVDTDAHISQVWCVLLQEEPDGPVSKIGYSSKTLNDRKKTRHNSKRVYCSSMDCITSTNVFVSYSS